MRSGTNPGKLAHELPAFKRHRVIVPVFIPNREGYYEHALEILQLCLESLCHTAAGRASITVISNGSMREANELVMAYFTAGRIDQVVLNERNWGKINAAVAAVHGRFEPLLSVADADVLFLPGWVEAVEEIFLRFPEAGFVTPAPNPALGFAHTTSTILSAFMRGELRRDCVVPEHDLDLFARSLGRPDYFTNEHRQSQLVVTRGGFTACVGGGHFVFTLRREVASQIPHGPVAAALGSGMGARFDDPPDASGVWRLSTTRAYARHMGNVPEPWMYDEISQADLRPQATVSPVTPLPRLRPSVARAIPLTWRYRALSALRKMRMRPAWAHVPKPSAS